MIRAGITRSEIEAAIATERAPHLIERIKIETRWLLICPSASPITYAQARRNLVAQWPRIRHRRMPAADIAHRFYDIAAEHAGALAQLITARRERQTGCPP